LHHVSDMIIIGLGLRHMVRDSPKGGRWVQPYPYRTLNQKVARLVAQRRNNGIFRLGLKSMQLPDLEIFNTPIVVGIMKCHDLLCCGAEFGEEVSDRYQSVGYVS